MKKLSLLVIALSSVAVFVGATLKLNGNPNSSIVLNIGLFSAVAGVLLLINTAVRKEKLK
jgi:uncharacterized membrane protein HdeD (DUF308 family)